MRTLRGSGGFTLIELLVAMALMAVFLTLGAAAVRNFWFVRSLEGGKDGMISTLREIQQRVTSASNPLVYGARFTADASEWELIQYNRDTGTCTDIRAGNLEPEQQFDAGVEVRAAQFGDYLDGAQNVTALCLSTGTDIAWFFARGSATAGHVTVRQPILGRTETVCVAAITGRVYEREGSAC